MSQYCGGILGIYQDLMGKDREILDEYELLIVLEDYVVFVV